MDVVCTPQPQAAAGKDPDHLQESFNMASMDEDGEDDIDQTLG
jgi:hypothetical protein